MRLARVSATVATAGAAGAATGSATVSFDDPVRLLGILVEYTSEPATTDVTAANMGRNVLAVTNTNTDTYYPVTEAAVKPDGTTVAAGDNTRVPAVLDGTVSIQVAGADDAGTVNVHLLVEFD